MNKKGLLLWSLYDFANSIIFINFVLYFSQWLVIDGGLSDFWYNAIFSVTSVMLLFSAPALASFTDKYGGRKYLLNVATVGTFLSYGLAVAFAYLGTQYIFIVTILFLLGQYFYQLSFVFYNTLIEDVADVKHRARASGIGQFANSIGQVAGLIIAIPLSTNRLQPLFPSLILFILLALPMMVYFVDSRAKMKKITVGLVKGEEKEYFNKMVAFFSLSVAAPVIVSYFFFNDALVTITNNYSIYMERVFAVPDITKNLLLMAILMMSAIGGLISGWIADRIGALKTLKYILIGWIILIPLLAAARNLFALSIFSVITGLLIGSVMAVTRAYLSEILKKEDLGYGFSFYTLFERFATLLGPLTYGGILVILGNQSISYRISIAAMTVFVIIGLFILLKWRREPSLYMAHGTGVK